MFLTHIKITILIGNFQHCYKNKKKLQRGVANINNFEENIKFSHYKKKQKTNKKQNKSKTKTKRRK